MQTLFSKPLIEELRPALRTGVDALLARGIEPHVADVMVGEDEQSLKYVDMKADAAKEYGIIFSIYHLEGESSFAEIRETISFLAADQEIHGIILQLPLPEQFTAEQVDSLIDLIPPSKDVDGLRGNWASLHYSRYSTESFMENQPYAMPPMVLSVSSLLSYYAIDLADKKIVLVGRGKLVGKPLETFYSKLGLQVQSVDETTENIISITQEADILITGTGEGDLVTYQWVKEGAVVIDCSRDVHVDSVSQVASALSPAVGGVGPLTVFWLMHNTYQAAKNQS